MCIRDRYTDVVQFFMLIIFVYLLIPVSSLNYLGGFDAFVSNLDMRYVTPYVDGQILGDIVTYLVSVSYTHLDVYKRQQAPFAD